MCQDEYCLWGKNSWKKEKIDKKANFLHFGFDKKNKYLYKLDKYTKLSKLEELK